MGSSAWLLASAFLVFLMQAGFLCLESGKIRSKNNINVAAKNLADFIIAAIAFWAFGFGIMFGESASGVIGASEFFFGAQHSAWQYSFFLFQLMFCGTAATLMSGAVAERMSFSGYIAISVILCCLIYPLVGHWAWASLFNPDNPGWLESLGFVDFAGSTVVHSVSGWVALASIIVIGPRLGRFDKKRKQPSASNMPFSVLGTLLIWLGWFGFNGGSALSLSDNVPAIILNTCLAGAWGGLAATLTCRMLCGYVDVSYMLNGVIAGLVAITASADVASPVATMLVGTGGGWLLERFRIDDVLTVVPVHLGAGVFGTLAVPFCVSALPEGLSLIGFLGVQLLGITVIGVFSFVSSLSILLALQRFITLRVSARDELMGMNISEHHASTEIIDLLRVMKMQSRRGNFNRRMPVEPFTEVGQIAQEYNRVIGRVQTEINQRQQALEDYRASEQRKTAILDSSMDSIITLDQRGIIREFNPAAERTFASLRTQVIGKNFIELMVPVKHRQAIYTSLEHKFTASIGLLINRRNTLHLCRSSGDTFPAEVTVTGAGSTEPWKQEFTLHIRDVTRQRKVQDKLRQLAYSDSLTGLFNRTYFLECLDKALKQMSAIQPTVCVYFLDLDRFKKINDTLGHKAGDELLIEVAKRLRSVTRDDDVIARWGGDEFVLYITGGINQSSAEALAEKILISMREPVMLAGQELKIPTSVGLTLCDESNVSPESLIQQADIAMYYAKQDGRDNYKVFRPEMANKASQDFNYEQAMRQALARDDEFYMVYQPKVNRATEIVGIESLVRWKTKESEQVSPAQFIPLAEDAGLIIPLEKKIIEMVFGQIASWNNDGYSVPRVAVNISGKHLLSGELLTYIKGAMNVHCISGHQLEIEVTEGVFLNDLERCSEVLNALRGMHIKISIDDFGTGYSSLNYLKTLPVDILKIDRSFVDECASSPEDSKICATIIGLAETLGFTTIAEGVENQAQFDFLHTNGCDEYQGYFFHRPSDADYIEGLLNKCTEGKLEKNVGG